MFRKTIVIDRSDTTSDLRGNFAKTNVKNEKRPRRRAPIRGGDASVSLCACATNQSLIKRVSRNWWRRWKIREETMRTVLSAAINKILLISSMAAFRCVFLYPRFRDASECSSFTSPSILYARLQVARMSRFYCEIFIHSSYFYWVQGWLASLFKYHNKKNKLKNQRNALGIYFTSKIMSEFQW